MLTKSILRLQKDTNGMPLEKVFKLSAISFKERYAQAHFSSKFQMTKKYIYQKLVEHVRS